MSLVSVVIPTWNREQYIGKALQSVHNQSYRPLEIIVIDDGSTDNTHQVVESFKSQTEIPVTYEFQDNQGAPVARNKGLAKANGEYITFLDSDDRLTVNSIHRRIEKIDNNKVSFGDIIYISKNKSYRAKKEYNDIVDTASFLVENGIPTSSMLYPTERVREVNGFDKKIRRGQEQELSYRLCLNGIQFVSVKDFVIKSISDTENSISKESYNKYPIRMVHALDNKKRFVDQLGPEYDSKYKYIAKSYWKLGRKLSKLKAKKEACESFQKALSIGGKSAVSGSYLYKKLSMIISPYYIERVKQWVGRE